MEKFALANIIISVIYISAKSLLFKSCLLDRETTTQNNRGNMGLLKLYIDNLFYYYMVASSLRSKLSYIATISWNREIRCLVWPQTIYHNVIMERLLTSHYKIFMPVVYIFILHLVYFCSKYFMFSISRKLFGVWNKS